MYSWDRNVFIKRWMKISNSDNSEVVEVEHVVSLVFFRAIEMNKNRVSILSWILIK